MGKDIKKYKSVRRQTSLIPFLTGLIVARLGFAGYCLSSYYWKFSCQLWDNHTFLACDSTACLVISDCNLIAYIGIWTIPCRAVAFPVAKSFQRQPKRHFFFFKIFPRALDSCAFTLQSTPVLLISGRCIISEVLL